MEERGCVFPPAGPNQKMGGASHGDRSLPGEETRKGSQEHHSGRSPSSGRQEAEEKEAPASCPPTTQGQSLPTVGAKVPPEPNMDLRLSLSLAWVRVCSCDM